MPKVPMYIAQQQPSGAVRGGLAQPVDLSGLSRGIASAAATLENARRFEQDLQDKTQASELLSTAQLDWTQHELERRKTYDPAGGKSYAAELQTEFDEYASKIEQKVSSDGARRLIRDRMRAMRTTLVGHAAQFEVTARADYRKQALSTTQDRRTVTAELDPSQALDVMAQQVADINNSAELSVMEKTALREDSVGAIAYAAAQTLATRDASTLRDHPVFALVPAKNLPGLLKLAEKSDMLKQSQREADSIMARGLPLDEAMKLIEQNHEGEREHAIKAEVTSRYSYADQARVKREHDIYGTAQLEVERSGRVSAETFAKLTDTHRAAILNRQQAEARQRRAEAEGRPIKTDFSLYLDLRQQAIDEPEKFARLDLKQYVDRIGGAQLEQLVDLKAKAANPASRRDATTLTQQMNATMAALNIKKAAKGQFQSFVQAAVDDATTAKGKPLSFDERQKIIDDAVLQGPDPDRILPWGERRMFELKPEQRQRFKPNASTDAPATEIEALNDALREQGLAQTPANRMALYNRAMSKATQ